MTQHERKPLIPGKAWPFVIVGMLAMNVVVCGITVAYALSSPYQVEPDYYEKAVAWDEHKSEFPDPATHGWSVSTTAADGVIGVRVTDDQGRPAQVSVTAGECYHRARSNVRSVLAFTPAGDGRFLAAADLDRPGVWELRLEIENGEAKARGRYDFMVAAD
jgi:nitrogen fixation protein FixH